jgi:hypothetical protein
MIVNTTINSICNQKDENTFEEILKKSKDSILNDDNLNPILIKGKDFEPYLLDRLEESSANSQFEGKYELVSGKYFPDIIACGYFGIEVKTITGNKWTTLGNSIFETTRLTGIEKIYMYCAQINNSKVDIRYKNYSDCLVDIAVTHSPRYLVDMGDFDYSIFDKMNVDYDTFRNSENPIDYVRELYRIKEGDVWWLEKTESSPVIRYWNNLDKEKKEIIVTESLVLFPELFSKAQSKFARITKWLLEEKEIICPNIRDVYTAGGKKEFIIRGNKKVLPQIYNKLYVKRRHIIQLLGIRVNEWADQLVSYNKTLTKQELIAVLTQK